MVIKLAKSRQASSLVLVDKLLGTTTTTTTGVVVSYVLAQLLGRGQPSGGVDESCFMTVDHHHGEGEVEKVVKVNGEKAVDVGRRLVATRIMMLGGVMDGGAKQLMAGVPALPRTTDGMRQVIIGIVALLAGVYSGVLVPLTHRR